MPELGETPYEISYCHCSWSGYGYRITLAKYSLWIGKGEMNQFVSHRINLRPDRC